MSDKREQPQYDSTEQKSDPDALRIQEGPLKQQGDALADHSSREKSEPAPQPERPRPN